LETGKREGKRLRERDSESVVERGCRESWGRADSRQEIEREKGMDAKRESDIKTSPRRRR
jgi:hypothetical protein